MKKKIIIFITMTITIFLLTACQHQMMNMFSTKESESTNHHMRMDDDHNRGHNNDQHMQEQPNGMRNGPRMHGNQMMIQSSTGENELAIPPLLTPDKKEDNNIYYTIEAKAGHTEIFDDISTKTLGYNGDFIGPALQVKKDQNVHVRLKNNLQEDTTVHWHGLIVGGAADGGPHDVIQPSEEKDIQFKVQQGEATLWFHPHPLGNTAKQVYEGLAGLLLIEGEYDKQFTYGKNDFPLIIQDKLFTNEGQIDYAAAYHPNGITGNTLLINGTVNPKLTVKKEKIRLRLLNGSNTRSYTFSLSNGASFEQVASDGGLLNEPLQRESVTLAPSERAEIIVDFSKMNGEVSLIAGDDINIMPFHITDEDGQDNTKTLKKAKRVQITK